LNEYLELHRHSAGQIAFKQVNTFVLK